jgi:hypothetical protein
MQKQWVFHLITAVGKSIMVFISMKILLFWEHPNFWMSVAIFNAPF